MVKTACFPLRRILKNRKKKRDRVVDASTPTVELNMVKPEQPFKSDELKMSNDEVIIPESPVGCEAQEIEYEGEDEDEENGKFSDLDFQAHVISSGEEFNSITKWAAPTDSFEDEDETKEALVNEEEEKTVDMIQSGHISDSGIRNAEFRVLPSLKRSCSNLETRKVEKNVAARFPSKFQSFQELQELSARVWGDMNADSIVSVMTHRSADRVMLKKHSSCEVLPSRSKRLWWKLFLWSHRNLHKVWKTKPKPLPPTATLNQQGGYSSDTVEPHRALQGFPNGVTASLWPQNQWVAFSSSSSSFTRVDEWVRDLEVEPTQLANDMNGEEGITSPLSPGPSKTPASNTTHLTSRSDMNLAEEIIHANHVILTLNSSSAVAHISGLSLKAIPMISAFSSLRSVNVSNNFIVQITPGSLPKGLQTLNLSRNKINNIVGLRELPRLRVVDLSYNRIARIEHGLSNCPLIKELYLAGNKISDVEGLHRLLKLTVLDLRFNKISTSKALGQLVAYYNSLQALNLLGNPVLGNSSDEQLRKAVSSLLPNVRYLNKQPIKPQRGRVVLTDSVAKVALEGGKLNSRRKPVKRSSKSGSFPVMHKNNLAIEKNRNKLKSRSQRK